MTLASYAVIWMLTGAPAEASSTEDVSAPSDRAGSSFYYPTDLQLRTEALSEHLPQDVLANNRGELERGLLKVLGAHKIDVDAEAPEAAALTIELRWVDGKRSIYGVQIDCRRSDGGSHSLEFELLGDHLDVLDRIEGEMPKILGWLERPDTSAEAPPPTPGTPAPDNGDNDRPRRPLGTPGKVGIPLMVVGAGALVAGGVLIARGEVVDAGAGQSVERTNFRPGGIALAVGGAALLLTGTALLIVDRVRARRRTAALVPILSPFHAGLSLHTRF